MAQSEHIIKNYDMLLSHGETKTRKVALDIAEAAIQRAIPYHETLRLIRRTPESISIGERTIFLREIDHIYVVGVGKGAYPIAQALEEKLGDLIIFKFQSRRGEGTARNYRRHYVRQSRCT